MSQWDNKENSQMILGDVRLLARSSEPCVVCGHPTGDCAGDAPPPHHIWGATEVPSMADETLVLVEEDIIRYQQITPFTKSKVLLARAGQQIPASRARELGIL
jgi:hypothetical protein